MLKDLKEINEVEVGTQLSVQMISPPSFAFNFMFIYRFDEYTKRASASYDADTTKLWDEDPDLSLLRRHVSTPTENGQSDVDIKLLHEKGVRLYLQGDWAEARDVLSVVDNAVGQNIKKFCHRADVMELEHVNEGVIGDGPSKTLLAFMAKRQNTAPNDWDPAMGRALTSK